MIAKLIPVTAITFLIIAASLPSEQAYAQASGLKLGQEAQTKPKLDLGAAPAKPSPAAPKAALSAGGSTGGGAGTYGAWEVACAQRGDNCAMAQIGKDNKGTPVLEMVVRKLGEPLEADGRTAIAVVDFITPLGVVLTTGLELTIDNGKGEVAPYQICTEQGCLVREPVDKGLIDRLKKGNNARAKVAAANQGDVTATISLTGFTKAFNALR